MKKSKLLMTGLMVTLLLTGCKGSTQLKAGDLSTSTLAVSSKGTIQAAMVESFEKEYYSESELKSYLEEALSSYNETAGSESIKMSSFQVDEKVASAVFDYSSIEDYNGLNGVDAKLLTMDEAETMLPASLIKADGSESTAQDILLEEKADTYKVLLLTEEYDVIVDGTVLYYANASMIDDKSVHTQDTDTSVIIYK